MTSKAMFSDEEWQTLQWAVTDTMTYVSMADTGFWDTFKEARRRRSSWPRPSRTAAVPWSTIWPATSSSDGTRR